MGTVERGRGGAAAQAQAHRRALVLQCFVSIAGTMIGEALGRNLPEKLIAGVLLAVVGAFLTAPGKHYHRRIVAVALLVGLLYMLRRALRALTSTGEDHRVPRPASHAWTPSSWSAVGLTAVVGFGLGSLGTIAIPDATDRSAGPAPTIKASSRFHDYTQAITIDGRVANHRSGIPVTLQATTFPYGSYGTVGQTSTQRGGYYRFRTRSDLATRYVVSLSKSPTVRSRVLTVYTYAHRWASKCNLCAEAQRGGHPSGPTTLRISLNIRYPAKVYDIESAKPLYFYYGQRNGANRPPARLRLVKTITGSPIGNDVDRVSVVHRITLPTADAYNFASRVCINYKAPFGGLGRPGRYHCGEKTIPYRQSRGYLG